MLLTETWLEHSIVLLILVARTGKVGVKVCYIEKFMCKQLLLGAFYFF